MIDSKSNPVSNVIVGANKIRTVTLVTFGGVHIVNLNIRLIDRLRKIISYRLLTNSGRQTAL